MLLMSKACKLYMSRKNRLERILVLFCNKNISTEEHCMYDSMGGSVAEWFRALDLKSGGPRFKSSTLLLSGFVLGCPEFDSATALCK